MFRYIVSLLFFAAAIWCSEPPYGAHISEQEWSDCERFIQTKAKRLFTQGVLYIEPGPDHPYAIQKDPSTGRIYVHLDGKNDSVIGIGGFKRVTQSILYEDHPELVARCQGWASLIREAEVLSKLETSSGIVHMKSFIGSSEGECSIILEYYNAGPLLGIEKKKLKISRKELPSVMKEVLEGLKNLHAAGYIHRDLHRGNILFTRKDGILHAALTDFGLALRMDEQPDAYISIQAASLSPESLLRKNSCVDRKQSEAYSLGILLYYMIFHERPSWCAAVRQCRAKGPHPVNKPRLYRYVKKQYAKTRGHVRSMKGVRRDLAVVVLQMLHPRPEKRIYLDSALHRVNAISKKRS
jgi:serine/threonine protein kinase